MAPDSINTIGGDIAVNGRTYRLAASSPTVVVCIDGSEPGYIEARRRGRPRAVVRQGAARAAPA